MKRILFISDCYTPVKGGAVTSAVRIVNGLVSQGMEITVLTPRVEGALNHEKNKNGLEIIRCPSFSFPTSTREFLINGFMAIRERLESFDLIMSFQASSPAFLGSICAASADKRHIVLCRGSDVNRKPDEDPVLQQLVQDTLMKADRVCVVSEEMHEKVLSFNVTPSNIEMIANSVDCGEFAPTGIQPEYDFLLVGPARPFKGFESVIQACGKLKGNFKVLAQIYSHGRDPEYFEHLKKMASDLGLNGQFTFSAPVPHSEMKKIYQKARCVIVASTTEGCSNVLLEAMASGRNVIIRDIPPMKKILGDRGESFKTDEELLSVMQKSIQSKWLPRVDLASYIQETYSPMKEIQNYMNLIGEIS